MSVEVCWCSIHHTDRRLTCPVNLNHSSHLGSCSDVQRTCGGLQRVSSHLEEKTRAARQDGCFSRRGGSRGDGLDNLSDRRLRSTACFHLADSCRVFWLGFAHFPGWQTQDCLYKSLWTCQKDKHDISFICVCQTAGPIMLPGIMSGHILEWSGLN